MRQNRAAANPTAAGLAAMVFPSPCSVNFAKTQNTAFSQASPYDFGNFHYPSRRTVRAAHHGAHLCRLMGDDAGRSVINANRARRMLLCCTIAEGIDIESPLFAATSTAALAWS